jgi:2-dehydro-3-deoxy-D-arabinonate dehydratase
MIIRYRSGDVTAAGVVTGDQVHPLDLPLSDLLRLPAEALRHAVEVATEAIPVPLSEVSVLAPVDGRTEVWAAGVTYKISQAARMEESERSADVYAQVYEADRPELFFKSVAWRVVGDGGEIRARADSEIDVPEPELALLVNAHGEIVGYGVCNDMSSRTIEAENPLYLPQAKIYTGSTALGPGITPVWEVADPYALELRLTITRNGAEAWAGTASVGQLNRRLDDLVDWLRREMEFPDGVWLSTGTCLVPDLPFTVADGDVITVEIPGVGLLSNPLRRSA